MDAGRDRVGILWAAGTLAVVVLAGLVGFVLLPAERGRTLWESVCLAVGIPPQTRAAAARGPVDGPSTIAWTTGTVNAVLAGDARAAAPLVQQCAACHGANGVGTSDQFPNLAAQVPDALYKQLMDFKTGKRVNPVMSPMAQPLDERQIANLSAHYAGMPGPVPVIHDAPALVTMGDPMRNIAPCASCHGGYGVKEGAPSLAGQKEPYLRAQLQAFAQGTRHNDINEQMRTVAKALTPQEMDALARWYALER